MTYRNEIRQSPCRGSCWKVTVNGFDRRPRCFLRFIYDAAFSSRKNSLAASYSFLLAAAQCRLMLDAGDVSRQVGAEVGVNRRDTLTMRTQMLRRFHAAFIQHSQKLCWVMVFPLSPTRALYLYLLYLGVRAEHIGFLSICPQYLPYLRVGRS